MSTENHPTTSAKSQQLVCASVLMMPLVYMAVAVAMAATGALPDQGFGELDETGTLLITGVFLVAGISSTFVSALVKRAILASGAGGSEATSVRFKSVLVAMAVSESGAVMGFVLILLTANVLYGALLCGLSFAATCFHFPRRHWLEKGDDPL